MVFHGLEPRDKIQFETFSNGDIVGIHLDLVQNIIIFSKNDEKFDAICDFVKPNTDYVLVVSMFEWQGNTGSQEVSIEDFGKHKQQE